MEEALSCNFNGEQVNDGDSTIAYLYESAAYGSSCISQSRTCNNGTLSGSYTFESCYVEAAATCSFNGKIITHGDNVLAYQAATAPFGSSCNSQNRNCNNGSLSGSYSSESCIVESKIGWPQQIGTTESDLAYSIFIDSSDNVFITGSTKGDLLGKVNTGNEDIFIIKFSEYGELINSNLINSKRFTSTKTGESLTIVPSDIGYGILVNDNNDLFLTGQSDGFFSDPTEMILDATYQNYSVSPSGYYTLKYHHQNDGFTVKIDENGDEIWARQTHEFSNCCNLQQNQNGKDLALDTDGNLIVYGDIQAYVFDGKISIGDFHDDIYLLKFDINGEKIWSARGGTSFSLRAGGMITDSDDNIYVSFNAGYYGSSYGGFAKYDNNGNLKWMRTKINSFSNGTYGSLGFRDIAVDSEGKIYVVGSTSGSFDDNRNIGNFDFLIFKTESGNINWSQQIGSTSYDLASAIVIDKDDNIYITGRSEGSFDGNQQIGSSDIILAKFNTDGEKQWALQIGTTQEDYAEDIAVDSKGNVYITGWTAGNLYGIKNVGNSDIFVLKFDSDGNLQ